jgi:hypothetical protein
MRGVVCLTVCVLASSAMAQQGRGRGGFGGGFGAGLLQMTAIETVQTELKLTDDQKGKLTALREEAQAARRGGAGGFDFQNASDEERQKFFAEQQKRTEEQNAKVTALLNADQNKRIKELALQQRANQGLAAALTAPEYVKEFKITDSQLASLRTIQQGQQSQTMELFQGGGGFGNPETQAKVAKIREEADKEVMVVLNADQKAAIEKAKGAKFEFPAFGGGQRRRGNNN